MSDCILLGHHMGDDLAVLDDDGLGLAIHPHLVVALHHAEDGGFLVSGPLDGLGLLRPAWLVPLGPVGGTRLPTHVGLVHLHSLDQLLVGVLLHELVADQVEHPPRRLVGHAQFSLKLLGRNATPSARHEVHGVEPQRQRRGRLVEDRPRCRVHVKTTGRAGPVLPLLLRHVPLKRPLSLATGAEGVFAVRGVAGPPQPVQAGLIVRKVRHELHQRVRRIRRECSLGGFAVTGCHSSHSRELGLYSQGIVAAKSHI